MLGASLLNGGKVEFAQKKRKLVLNVPASRQQPADTIVKLELDGSAMDLPAQETASDTREAAASQ